LTKKFLPIVYSKKSFISNILISIEVAIFCPKKILHWEKKTFFSFFFQFFSPQCRGKKTIQKNISPIKTLSTQPLGGLAIDFENFTFFS
jgi:hypothetical protein